MDALIQLRSAVSDARNAQTRTQSELVQAIADLQKWEERERLVIEKDKPQLASATAFRKSVCAGRVKSLKSLVNANAETVSRLERQLALWEAPKQPAIPSARAIPKPSLIQQLQDRQDLLDKKISKLTTLLFEVQLESQMLKKEIEKSSLAEKNQETFSSLELEELRLLLDEL